MPKSEMLPPGERTRGDRGGTAGERDKAAVDTDEFLSLVSDDYARRVLAALADEPLPARAVVERIDASRPTVYRRLERLEAAGVVESSMSVHPDGHHRRQFRVAVERVRLGLERDGVAVDVAD
jgi:DNA-binding transcriptional ArsR family regulator